MAQTTLTGLSPREAVADALHRVVLGIDTNNHPLFSSGMLQDESASVTAGPATLQGWPAINSFFQRVFELVTLHSVTNIRVHLPEADANTASLTAHAVAYHMATEDALKKEDGSYTAGCLYLVDLVRDPQGEGVWRIKTWRIQMLWSTGDIRVLHPNIEGV